MSAPAKASTELHEQIAREAARLAETIEGGAIDEGTRSVDVKPLVEAGLLAPEGVDPVARDIIIEALARQCASTAVVASLAGIASRVTGDPAFAAGAPVGLALDGLVLEGRRVRGKSRVVGAGTILVRAGSNVLSLKAPATPIPRVGLRGVPVSEVAFDHEGRLVEGASADWLRDRARAMVAPIATGLVARGLAEATRYAMMRQQFGRAIAKFQGVQFLVAQIYEAGEGCRALARAYAAAESRGEEAPRLAAACALEAPATAVRACLDVVQVFGGMGYIREVVAERLLRDALALQSLSGDAAETFQDGLTPLP